MLFHVPLMARHRIITVARLRNRSRRRQAALSTQPGQLVAQMEMPQPGQLVARMATAASASPRERLLVQAAVALAALMAAAQVVVGVEAVDAAMVSVVAARR